MACAQGGAMVTGMVTAMGMAMAMGMGTMRKITSSGGGGGCGRKNECKTRRALFFAFYCFNSSIINKITCE